tara:strand:- start:2163 stop:2543 length:381 start_codon:yes stop_codon:yes gene_type:complete
MGMNDMGSTVRQEIWDEEDALKRVMGKEQILAAMVESFLETMPEHAQKLADDLANKDISAAALSSHALKGAAANLSTQALANVAGNIERACRNHASLDEVLAQYASFDEIFRQSCMVLSDWQSTRK